MPSFNYYDILEIPKTASNQEIKKAYKKMALKYHPDKNKSNKQKSKEMFIKVAEAYDCLSNPQKRKAYDNPPSSNNLNSNYRKTNNYEWDNPQFSPEFSHFKDFDAPNFKFKERFNIPIFDFEDFQQFGSFTFEKAEKIFQKVFKQFPNVSNQLSYEKIEEPNFSLSKKYSEPFQPKNSQLISEKVVERKGRQILIRKFSIQEKGSTHTETHQSVIR